jgi:hypothetical protein
MTTCHFRNCPGRTSGSIVRADGIELAYCVAHEAIARNLPLLADGPHYSDKICLVFRADAQRSRASRRIAQYIESRFNPETTPGNSRSPSKKRAEESNPSL